MFDLQAALSYAEEQGIQNAKYTPDTESTNVLEPAVACAWAEHFERTGERPTDHEINLWATKHQAAIRARYRAAFDEGIATYWPDGV